MVSIDKDDAATGIAIHPTPCPHQPATTGPPIPLPWQPSRERTLSHRISHRLIPGTKIMILILGARCGGHWRTAFDQALQVSPSCSVQDREGFARTRRVPRHLIGRQWPNPAVALGILGADLLPDQCLDSAFAPIGRSGQHLSVCVFTGITRNQMEFSVQLDQDQIQRFSTVLRNTRRARIPHTFSLPPPPSHIQPLNSTSDRLLSLFDPYYRLLSRLTNCALRTRPSSPSSSRSSSRSLPASRSRRLLVVLPAS